MSDYYLNDGIYALLFGSGHIRGSNTFEEAAPTMTGSCPWPHCSREIHSTSAFCFEHARYVRHALGTLPTKTAEYISAKMLEGEAGPSVALNLIRACELGRGLDYLNKKIGGMGV